MTRRRHALRLLLQALLTAALVVQAGAAEPPPAPVEAVKAAYLVKFAPFVDWPAVSFRTETPFTICVVGGNPFGADLDRAAAGQIVRGRPIVVRRAAKADPSCQIAYLSGPAGFVRAQLALLRGQPTLTVTDNAGAEGVIDFQLIQDRVRFRVDEAAAAADGLTISSKLLDIALTVRRRPEARP